MNYIKKLKDIDGKIFTIKEIYPGIYKHWNDDTKTMDKKEKITPEEKAELNSLGFPKWKYVIDTVITINGEEFGCPFSFSQIKEMKVKTNANSDADLKGLSFECNTNGMTGKEIRYYFKPIKNEIELDDII